MSTLLRMHTYLPIIQCDTEATLMLPSCICLFGRRNKLSISVLLRRIDNNWFKQPLLHIKTYCSTIYINSHLRQHFETSKLMKYNQCVRVVNQFHSFGTVYTAKVSFQRWPKSTFIKIMQDISSQFCIDLGTITHLFEK